MHSRVGRLAGSKAGKVKEAVACVCVTHAPLPVRLTRWLSTILVSPSEAHVSATGIMVRDNTHTDCHHFRSVWRKYGRNMHWRMRKRDRSRAPQVAAASGGPRSESTSIRYGTTIGEYISTYGTVEPERNRTPMGSTKCSAVLGSTHSDSNFRSSLQVTFLLIVSYPQAIHWQQRSSIIGPPAGKRDAPSASHNYQSTSLLSSSSSSGSNAPRRVV